MREIEQTSVSPLKIREPLEWLPDVRNTPAPDWQTVQDLPPKHSLLKNLAVASALVLCAVTLRTGALPSLDDATDAILTAATDQSLLDDQLGKLSFVSSLFPEAVLVFGETQVPELTLPVSGGVIVHAWSEQEPYTTFRANTSQAFSAIAGEVSGVYHGNGDERLVQITNGDGISCLYGNLQDVCVQIGDSVQAGHQIGTILPGEDIAFEIRMDGHSIDPARWFAQ